jgi:hypothetical protein
MNGFLGTLLASGKKHYQIIVTIVQAGGLSLKFKPKTWCMCVSTSDACPTPMATRVDAKSDTT